MRLHDFGLFAVVMSLAACGNIHPGTGSTQVVAKVNGQEITVHQLNAALKQVGASTSDSSQIVLDSVMERLVNQELLVQQAHAAKLDQSPAVVQAIEAAKRSILASAYLQQAVANMPEPSEKEVHDYYTQHPDFFANRRIYVYRSIVVQGPRDELESAQQMVGTTNDLDAAIGYLRTKKLDFLPKTLAKGDEEIPQDELPRFAALKEGAVAAFLRPDGLEIVKLITSTAEPVDEIKGRPFIVKFLKERERNERAAGEVKSLRTAAKIEFLGDFKAVASAAPKSTPGVIPGASRDDVTKAIAKGMH
jgi:EpsD family peptidyl-prolyl cis-trans isomerase